MSFNESGNRGQLKKNLGCKTNCWLPFVKLQNFSSLPISEVPKSGTHSSAVVCLHSGDKVLLDPGSGLCAVEGQCRVAVASSGNEL